MFAPVAILAALTVVGFLVPPRHSGLCGPTKTALALHDMHALAEVYERRRATDPTCPTTLEELQGRFHGLVLDPWGNAYRHGCTPGPEPELLVISAGPDGKFGTGDEITGDW